MNKWIKQNLTAAIIITLLGGYGAGAALAAVVKSDIERLKSDAQKLREQMQTIPERLGKLEQKTDDIKESVYRIEDYFKYE